VYFTVIEKRARANPRPADSGL